MKESCAKNSLTSTPRGHRCQRSLESFSSKKSSCSLFQNVRTYSAHKRRNIHFKLRQIPRKCEAWASIFVEMYAQTLPCNQHPENASVGAAFLLKCSLCTSYHPLKACRSKPTTVFLFAFFGYFLSFFFCERKRERK